MSTAALWLLMSALWLGCLRPGAGALALAGLVALGLAGWARPLPEPRRLALVVLALALVGSALAGLRAELRAQAVLAQLGRERAVVTVRARAISDARATPGGWWQLLSVSAVDGRRVRERALARWSPPLRPVELGEGVLADVRADALGHDGFAGYVRRLHAVAEVRVLEVRARSPAPRPLRAAEAVRGRARSAAEGGLGQGQRPALLLGLSLGDDRGLDDEPFRRSGLVHLVVASGWHVALASGWLLALGRLLRLRFATRRVVVLAGVAALVVLLRPQPSVLRAAGAAAFVAGLQLAGRHADGLRVLPAVAGCLLLADPELAGQLGFALSVAAVAGVLAAGRLVRRLRDLPAGRGMLRLVAAALGAQLAVAPLLLAGMGSLPLLALPANLVALPLAALAQALGVASALAAQVSVPLGAALARAAAPALAGLLAVAALFARGPVIEAAALLPPGVGTPPPGRLPAQVGELTVTAFDVGQGDALLVEAPGPGRAVRMLVDAGPEPDPIARLLPRLGVRRLDLVVLSHSDRDHSGGMAEVLRRIGVGGLLVGPVPPPADAVAAHAALREARARRVPVLPVRAGHSLALGRAVVEVLGPPPEGFPGHPPNEHSLVLRVRGPGGRVLLTGDSEAVAQDWLLRRPDRLRAELLKVPHHGGDTNAPGFLGAVGACAALLSAGRDNPYGHPHPDVLAALRRVPVWRTDLRGTIRLPMSSVTGAPACRSSSSSATSSATAWWVTRGSPRCRCARGSPTRRRASTTTGRRSSPSPS